VAEFLIRLWTHEAEDGLLPEVNVTADSRIEAAALALQHFVSIGRPMTLNSYLECEPRGDEALRAADVLRWLNATGGDLFYVQGNRDPVLVAADPLPGRP
jgi:hypothetical protein